MRISCPSCAAIYEVPTELLGGEPRKLRCTRCGTEWTRSVAPAPIAIPAVPESVPGEAPSARSEASADQAEEKPAPAVSNPLPREPSRAPGLAQVSPPPEVQRFLRTGDSGLRQRASAAVWVGWTASIIVLALLIWAGYNFRAGVMHAWPPSQHLYTALGLGPGAPPSAPPRH